MHSIYNTYHPEGFSTVNGYLFTENMPELIDFLKNAFYAEELSRTVCSDNGDIANLILKIGASCIMLSQARGGFTGMSTSYYLYVNDVDALFKRALEHGASTVFEPADMEYGDRQGGVQDPAGNYWWISTRLKKMPYEKTATA